MLRFVDRLGERFRELDTPLLVEWPDGRRAVLLLRRLLMPRFGPLPEWVEWRLIDAEPAQLERWGERAMRRMTGCGWRLCRCNGRGLDADGAFGAVRPPSDQRPGRW